MFVAFVSVVILLLFHHVHSLVEAPDGSVCFDNCNGHGNCVDYSCQCFVGYHGDDCKMTYALDENNIVPILGAGHFNVSRKEFPSLVVKSPMLLVGFSSPNCHKCIQVEPSYSEISEYLKTVKIPFARANVDEMKSIAIEHEAQDIPSLVLFKKQRPYLYKASHDAKSVITYIKKQLLPPVTVLKTNDEFNQFLDSFIGNKSIPSLTVVIVGFFSSHQDIEEDEYDEFMELAKELQSKEDIYFGVVFSKPLISKYKKDKLIDRTPSIMLQRDKNTRYTINLDEFIGERIGLKEWIERKSIPLVGKMDHHSYRLYEKIQLPMLLLFLDLRNEDKVVHHEDENHGVVVGGKSGGILNEILLDEYRLVAKEYSDRISFVYVDGVAHEDKMRSLGIYGGVEGLPSLAFNTKDGRQVPFPNELPINYDTLNQYCAEFLTGRLRSPKDALELVQKALKSTIPLSSKNKATRKDKKTAPEAVQGVSEQYGDGRPGDDAIVMVNSTNFEDIVMVEDKDVAMVFYSQGCESCAHFAVYYKRMAQRFQSLDIPSLVIARMDLTEDSPPAHLNVIASKLPLFMIFPAGAKHPPWSYYSGVSKIQSMMKWIQQQASIPFELPHLPHLNDEQVILYKQQVREREEYMEEKRNRETDEIETEDRERVEVEKRRQQRLEEMRRLAEEDDTNLEL